MNKLISRIIIALILAIFAVPASAQVRRQVLQPGDFTTIRVLDNLNVVCVCRADSAGYAVFYTTDEIANALIFTKKKDNLKVQVEPEFVQNPDLPTIYLYCNFLTEIKNEANGTLEAVGVPPCPSFLAMQMGNGRVIANGLQCTKVEGNLNTGNGTVVLSGNCSQALFKMVGTGTIQADNLKATDVECKILGGGTIGLDVTGNLLVKGLGSTKIYYKGKPASVKKSGGGKLFPMD